MSQQTVIFFMTGAAFCAVVYLVVRAQRELTAFIEELKFYLHHRTIAHNKATARLSIMTSRYHQLEQESLVMRRKLDQVEKENDQLRLQVEEADTEADRLSQEMQSLQSVPAATSTTSTDKSRQTIEQLEMEISSIQSLLSHDIGAQINTYMKEVDGLSQKIKDVKAQTKSA